MKWIILVLGAILAVYEIVTLIIQIVRKKKKKKISLDESEQSSAVNNDK